jgi:acetoin utilization deacetylase AcuC-like enzyme
MTNPNFYSSIKGDSEAEVKSLFKAAEKRKEDALKYRLLAELLQGKVIDVTKSQQLFEALNRERMEFEEILKLHPEEVADQIEYVKQRKIEQEGKWWNPQSKAKWGDKGVIPPCCYYARPKEYWKNKQLVDNFFNTFSKFRISERPL